jgi:hypothetical protein
MDLLQTLKKNVSNNSSTITNSQSSDIHLAAAAAMAAAVAANQFAVATAAITNPTPPPPTTKIQLDATTYQNTNNKIRFVNPLSKTTTIQLIQQPTQQSSISNLNQQQQQTPQRDKL